MTHPTRRFVLKSTVVAGVMLSLPIMVSAQTTPDASRWIISAEEARTLIADGALVFDTRNADLAQARPINGAAAVIWQDFTKTEAPLRGQLLDDDAVLSNRLRALGVSQDRPVIAVADSRQGWGEDGRVVWTLRTLGHTQSYLVDGGIDALLEDGDLTLAPIGTGDFTVARTDAYDITKEELAERLDAPNLVILDTRESREFAGETPYGETRGGHVPGAQHIHFQDLVGDDGHILDGDALKARLASLGVTKGAEVVSYCTGGIRSGFVTAVLNNAGFNARNYAGSMWEWSAAPAEEFPLATN
ncbi:sulfurtransferase [Yoonia sp.]|uniref:sulfurtransferase n=1 Tax=Yoonia sp. TaxID=2212373 RepID=UPI003A4DADE0